MTRPNDRDYDERYENQGERARQSREQSDRAPYQQHSGEPRAQVGGHDNDRWPREGQGRDFDPSRSYAEERSHARERSYAQERSFPPSNERGYDRGSYSQPGYAQRNYDEGSLQRAGYDRGREPQYGQSQFDRGNWEQPREEGGYRPSPRFGESNRGDWSGVNDSRGGWSRPSLGGSNVSNTRSGGFVGKGPKGYTRSDDRIREDVCDRLSADDELDASEITVTVAGGEVTLEGTVPDRRSKHRAEDLCDAVAGVSDVHNQLRAQKGLVKEVSDKLLGREEPDTGHHAGSGTRNNPAGSSASPSRSTGVGSSSNESLNHR